jgi:DNA-binding transcriptional MerR regulator
VLTNVTNVFTAFSVEHAARVTGLSKTRLSRWDKLGFFSPENADDDDRGNAYSRVYSFTDLVGLRALAVLTDEHGISIQELKKTAPELAKRSARPWSEISLAVVKKKVVWDLETIPRDRHGQLIGAFIPLETIATQVAERAERLRNRNRSLLGSTERHRFIAHNVEVLAGTRIPVKTVESFIDAGYSDKDILAEYPTLTKIDVQFVRSGHKVAA